MSSTNHTTNYGLSQFLGTDKPAWLVDYNGDMAAIDTQMKANADAAAGAQTTANTADGKADTNASAISTLDTQINGASGIASDVTTLQGSVNTVTSLIGNGEPTTTDKTLIGAINELNAGKLDSDDYFVELFSSVTADGVKTYGALIDEAVAGLIAQMDADHRYMMQYLDISGGGFMKFNDNLPASKATLSGYFSGPGMFGNAYGFDSITFVFGFLAKTSGSTYDSQDYSTDTFTSYTANVATSGITVTVSALKV